MTATPQPLREVLGEAIVDYEIADFIREDDWPSWLDAAVARILASAEFTALQEYADNTEQTAHYWQERVAALEAALSVEALAEAIDKHAHPWQGTDPIGFTMQGEVCRSKPCAEAIRALLTAASEGSGDG